MAARIEQLRAQLSSLDISCQAVSAESLTANDPQSEAHLKITRDAKVPGVVILSFNRANTLK